MMRLLIFTLMFTGLTFAQDGYTQATQRHDGEVKTTEQGMVAWSQSSNTWLTLDEFWQQHALRSGGLTWGERKDYPPYEQVKEYDLLLIQLPQGPCLMEFFHQRWRRANDVRRWDDAFNEYAGCPFVFD